MMGSMRMAGEGGREPRREGGPGPGPGDKVAPARPGEEIAHATAGAVLVLRNHVADAVARSERARDDVVAGGGGVVRLACKRRQRWVAVVCVVLVFPRQRGRPFLELHRVRHGVRVVLDRAVARHPFHGFQRGKGRGARVVVPLRRVGGEQKRLPVEGELHPPLHAARARGHGRGRGDGDVERVEGVVEVDRVEALGAHAVVARRPVVPGRHRHRHRRVRGQRDGKNGRFAGGEEVGKGLDADPHDRCHVPAFAIAECRVLSVPQSVRRGALRGTIEVIRFPRGDALAAAGAHLVLQRKGVRGERRKAKRGGNGAVTRTNRYHACSGRASDGGLYLAL